MQAMNNTSSPITAETTTAVFIEFLLENFCAGQTIQPSILK